MKNSIRTNSAFFRTWLSNCKCVVKNAQVIESLVAMGRIELPSLGKFPFKIHSFSLRQIQSAYNPHKLGVK